MCVCENYAEKEDCVSVSDNRKVWTKWSDEENRIVYSICIRAITLKRLIEREHKVDRQRGKNSKLTSATFIKSFLWERKESRKLMRKVIPLIYFSFLL